MEKDAFNAANAMLEEWALKWLTEQTRVYTHCKECGAKLSNWERENHCSICKSCADAINYGGSLGYRDMRM